MAMMELTCPLDSAEHLQSAQARETRIPHDSSQSKLHCLGVDCSYNTVEVSVLDHYLTASLSSPQASIKFIYENSISNSISIHNFF